jgi:hypothetical protein
MKGHVCSSPRLSRQLAGKFGDNITKLHLNSKHAQEDELYIYIENGILQSMIKSKNVSDTSLSPQPAPCLPLLTSPRPIWH